MKKLFFLLFLVSGSLGAMEVEVFHPDRSEGLSLEQALKYIGALNWNGVSRKEPFRPKKIAASLKTITDSTGELLEKVLDYLGELEEKPALLKVLSEDSKYQHQKRAQELIKQSRIEVPGSW